ncbi:UDP-N-acetylmuramoyl-tripeptide--D-alanyl-D-alanine ligase [Kordiimonas sp. SCSIO 12610]|uniref:UDP-N-acetylmuramoyl-tripeptide--D-alanyl-D- alanine ligase n=1 Tax=Kordiimonas sp. SCSIO 12610 TaxID=2829597 RepID=UPI00210E0AB2|nr:UDP-N-acetylmuramoyl-tripeptide--D-alanyl-D-alanine ligase [Kordiimonas sp. SCSIO 12610]UTW56406.1 UDP-N-acetylmuramoyl-tripeptide--D-alanyl-D-alanine ligase [Kordiimonas sp. SCSIO 12610]
MLVEEPLWTSSELSAISDAICNRPWFADAVQVDSREVLPGDLFIALRGTNLDGHDYVTEALSRGAAAVIVSERPNGISQDDPRLIKVDDTLVVLAEMARYARTRAPMKTIAVTGSAGKTSVVQALRKALSKVGPTHSSIKSFNNHVGVPLSLSRIPRSTRYGIFELGMNRPGEIANRSALVQPDVAIITNVSSAHRGNFDVLEDIAREKASILEGVKEGGTAVINIDHPHVKILKAAAFDLGVELVTVSLNPEAGADIYPIQMTERYDCTCMTAQVGDATITYKISQPGPEWAMNSLLVLAGARAVGADLGEAVLALASLEAELGRGQMHLIDMGDGNYSLIDDSYNANVASMEAAFKRTSMVPLAPQSRRFAILGDMRELGQESEIIHLSLAKQLRKAGIHKVFAVGPMMEKLARHADIACEAFDNTDGLADRVMTNLQGGDVLLVKGANSVGLGETVSQLIRMGAESYAFQSFGRPYGSLFGEKMVAE